MNRRDFTIGVLTATAAGSLLALPEQALADQPVGKIVVDNDYSGNVSIHLYHPLAINRRFGTWRVGASQKLRLDQANGELNIRGDWGIQVEFENGALSTMNRVRNISSIEDGGYVVKATAIYQTRVGYSDQKRIKTISGYDIDDQFGPVQIQLLRNALGYFYERFLQDHWAVLPELGTLSGTMFSDRFPYSDFKAVDDDSHDYMMWQFTIMDYLNTSDEGAVRFPRVKLQYGNEVNGAWLAQAYFDKVKVNDATHDERYEGSFEIQMNDYYLNNVRLGRHYASPEFWAGVIAHEALHNLGHGHPKSRSDAGYYQYQMILIEYLVMTNGRVRYGDSNPTPVLCRRRPV